MSCEFEPDLAITPLVITTSGTDASVTIPNDLPGGLSPGARNTGSLYYVNVHGSPAGIRYGAAAVFGGSATFEVGNNVFGGLPVRIPPGTTVHAITGGSAGTVSLIRARRAG